MNNLLSNIRIDVTPHLYIKDPYSSELGMNIVKHGIELIDEIGYEDFTFRKLGQLIHSPEASIYRYFESKQKFILYLGSWYWAWMEYRLVLSTSNIPSAEKRLEKALELITVEHPLEREGAEIDLNKLNKIVSFESGKFILTKQVDNVNKEGAFLNYKNFVARVSAIVSEINAGYKFPNMLVTTIIEGAHLQRFYGEHLPGLTNKLRTPNYICRFYSELIFNTIKKKA
jgi:AcrR family transcriptional regulator